MDDSESDTILQNAALSHCALVHAVRSLNSKAAVIKGDHRKERTETHEFKIYWPLQLQHVRRTRGVSNDELISELSDELYPPSKHDYPKRCLHSGRKRLLVRELSYSEMVVLKSIIGRYVDHMVENPASFLQTILCVVRIGDISTSGIFHIRKKTDYTYIVMTNTVIPQISHEILHKFLLSTKVVTPVRAYVYGASTQETFSLDHELAMNPKERKIALEQLDRDINLLQSLNLDNYCIFYVIALREKAYIMQLPGAPYGPEIDGVIEFDRKDTIPHRHDIRYGAHATPAQLIPVPLKNYEFIEREYFAGIVDILLVDNWRDRLNSVHVFGERGRGLAPESCGDPVAAEKFAFSFMNFIRNKLMPNYSLEDSDDGSAFSEFEDP